MDNLQRKLGFFIFFLSSLAFALPSPRVLMAPPLLRVQILCALHLGYFPPGETVWGY